MCYPEMYEEYRNGSIISLHLTNFQTYTDMEFKFHPFLNFIAGPNGSGKSTIGNALCFIFGGSPIILNKAKDIRDYIKFNAIESTIEIKIKKDKKILKIKRIISTVRNKTTWWMNDIVTKFNVIKEIYNELKIDISNICNYLPQEKVSEFTRYSPEDLFKLFVNTYSNQKIIKNMQNLILSENSLESLTNDLEQILTNKKSIENAMNHMIKDINKIKEKEESEKRVKLMEAKKDWLVYESEKKTYLEIKQSITRIDNNLEILRNEVEKSKRELEKEQERDEIQQLNRIDEEVQILNIKLIKSEKKIVELKHEQEKTKIDLKGNEKKRYKQLEKIDQLNVERMQILEKLENFVMPEEPKTRDFSDLEQLETELNEEKKKLKTINHQNAIIAHEIDQLTKQKNIIVDFELQRMELLKNFHRDTYTTISWLRNNKHQFKDEIIEPCFISLRIKDYKYIAEIEGLLSFQSITSFICKNSEDFELFTKTVKDEKKWGVNVVEYKFKEKKKPLSNEKIRMLGYDGYIIDFVDDRKEILEYLSTAIDFSQIPVTKNIVDEQELFQKYNFRKVAIRGKYIAMKRSIYNSDDYIIKENKFKRSNIFKQTGTQEELKIIEQKIAEFQAKRIQNRKIHDNSIKLIEDRGLKIVKLTNLKNEQRVKYLEYQKKKKHKIRILNERNSIEDEIEKLDMSNELKQEKQEIENKIEEIKKSIFEIFKNIKNSTKKEELKFFELLQRKQKIQNEIAEFEKMLKELQIKKELVEHQIKDLEAEKQAFEKDKEAKMNKIKTLKKGLVSFTIEEMKLIHLVGENIKKLDEQIAIEYAKIAFINTDKSIVQDFHQKEKLLQEFNVKQLEIEKRRKISNTDINNMKEEILEYLADKIEIINSKFQNYFNALNFEGKIELETKNLHISKWKLQILVKFRKNEAFQQLSSNIQSGGERSVSTICFLLSLLHSTPSPFRLVDEINQGMDAVNERIIHKLLVDSIDSKNSPQFFIITPKLVSDLHYNENMRVFILYTGEIGRIKDQFEKYKASRIEGC